MKALASTTFGLALALGASATAAVSAQPQVTTLGSLSSGMVAPTRLAVDGRGRVLVTDASKGSLVIFDAAGRKGSEHAGLRRPLGIAVAPSGKVFLAEEEIGTVTAYDAEGNTLYVFGGGEHEFQLPNHLAVDAGVAGDAVYVSDSKANQVSLYLDGKKVVSFGQEGAGDGQFSFPTGICVSPDGSVYVVDQGNDRVQVFDRGGRFLRTFRIGAGGAGAGPSGRSQAVSVDDSGRLYVADSFQGVVNVYDAATGTRLSTVGGFGKERGQLSIPSGMAFDSFGRLGVASVNNGRVEFFGIDRFVHVTIQPEAAALATGSAVTLSAAAGGSGAVSYQWKKNGVAVEGATASTLNLATAGLADSGSYSVTVSSASGEMSSGAAQVTVMDPPQVLEAPKARLVMQGSPARFEARASGTNVRYQWQWNGWDLAGATASSLELTDVQAGQAGDYAVVVSNEVGTVTSSPALLRVVVPPSRMDWGKHRVGADGVCNLSFSVDPGYTYVVEASSDLARWEVLTTVTPSLADVDYADAAAAGLPLRFYRLRWLPPVE